jgi:nitrous oxidase accessory protein NosD
MKGTSLAYFTSLISLSHIAIRNISIISLSLIASTLTIPASAETTECTEITSLPAVIDQQGVYCLKGNLSTSITSGSAIEIVTNNVTIDFNGWKLGGLGAGPTTQTIGVNQVGRDNIILRGGNIRGFHTGVYMNGGSGHSILDSTFDGNRENGIAVTGNGILVRNNRIVNSSHSSAAFGIYANEALGVEIVNNKIDNLVTTSGNGFGIYTINSDSPVIKNNSITDILPASSAYGIRTFSSGFGAIRDNEVINSAAEGFSGISSSIGTSICIGNVVANYTTENSGCVDGGGNYPDPF